MARRAGAGKRADLSFSVTGAHKRARLGAGNDSLVSAASTSISGRPPWWHIVDGPEPWDAAAAGDSGAVTGAGSGAVAGSSSLVQFEQQWRSGVLTQPAQQEAASAVETVPTAPVAEAAAVDTSVAVESAAAVRTQADASAAVVDSSAASPERTAASSSQPVVTAQQQQQQQQGQMQEPVHGDAPAEPVHAEQDSGGCAVSESLASFGASPAAAVLTSQSEARTRALQAQVRAMSCRIAALAQNLAAAAPPAALVRAPAAAATAVAATPEATAAVTAAQAAARTRRRSSAAAAAASVAAAVAATVADAAAGTDAVPVLRAPAVRVSAATSPPQARPAPASAAAVSPPQPQRVRVRRSSAEDSSASSGVLHELPVLSLRGEGAAGAMRTASGSAGAGDAAPRGPASAQSRAQAAGSELTRRAAAAERARSIRHSASSPVPQQLGGEPVAFSLAAFTPVATTAADTDAGAASGAARDPYAAAQQDMQRFTAEALAGVQQLQRDTTSTSTDTAESASPPQQQQQQQQQSPPSVGRSARSSSRGAAAPVVAVPGAMSDAAVSSSGSARLQQPRPAGRARPWSSVSPARGECSLHVFMPNVVTFAYLVMSL
jgi:trimeric autotransporter adhesin